MPEIVSIPVEDEPAESVELVKEGRDVGLPEDRPVDEELPTGETRVDPETLGKVNEVFALGGRNVIELDESDDTG